MNIALGAFYVKYNINNLQTMRIADQKSGKAFERFFIWRDGDNPTGPHYILCEPTVTKAGTKYVQMKAYKLLKYRDIPLIPYDVFNALQLLPPEAYFEFVKSLMKHYGE